MLTFPSLVIRTLVTVTLKSSCGVEESSVNRRSWLHDLGDLCFVQLAELRHRGAFSAVAQTFATLCHQCAISEQKDTAELIEIWYQVMRAVLDQSVQMC